MTDTKDIFTDLKVIELASVLAGPAVGMFFVELGATVIKIENKRTGGDVTRRWKLPEEDQEATYSSYFHCVNWNKESLFLDISQAEDYAQLQELITSADVVISNYKTASAQRLKIDYDSLKQINPQLIYGSISAYGADDPRPGFDVVIQAEGAWISMNGEAGGTPVKLPVALMDLLTAHQLKEGLLVALLKRFQTGKGSQVRVSLFDAGVSSLANQASNWLNADKIAQPMGSQHPNIAPYGDTFFSKDGKLLITSAGTSKQYEGLLDCLELGALKEDPRFQSNPLRVTHRAELNDYLSEACARWDAVDILNRCAENNVPVAPIRNMQELFELPEAQALILEEEMEDGYVSKRLKTVVFELED